MAWPRTRRTASGAVGFGNAERTDSNSSPTSASSLDSTPILAAQGTPHGWLAERLPGTIDFDAAEASDGDVDGFPAGQEYAADTDPGNSSEFFCVDSALPPWIENAIRFHSSTGRLTSCKAACPRSTPGPTSPAAARASASAAPTAWRRWPTPPLASTAFGSKRPDRLLDGPFFRLAPGTRGG